MGVGPMRSPAGRGQLGCWLARIELGGRIYMRDREGQLLDWLIANH